MAIQRDLIELRYPVLAEENLKVHLQSVVRQQEQGIAADKMKDPAILKALIA